MHEERRLIAGQSRNRYHSWAESINPWINFLIYRETWIDPFLREHEGSLGIMSDAWNVAIFLREPAHFANGV